MAPKVARMPRETGPVASVGWPGIRLWGWNEREQLQRATGWPTSRGSVRWLRPLRVKEIAEQKASAPGQLALAWVMAQGNDVVPIPGYQTPPLSGGEHRRRRHRTLRRRARPHRRGGAPRSHRG